MNHLFLLIKAGYVLDRSIRLCVGTWEGEPGSLSSGILKGIAIMISAFEDTMRDDIFKEKVGYCSSLEISRSARERKHGSFGYAEAMLVAYNRKAKKGLSWTKLFEGRKRLSLPMCEDFDMIEEEGEEYQQEVLE